MNQVEWGDEDVSIIETSNREHGNKTIRFGPLSCTLNDLFSRGFRLRCVVAANGLKWNKKVKIHLINNTMRERYKICTVQSRYLYDHRYEIPLSSLVRDNIQLMGRISENTPDELDVLVDRYRIPKRKKKKTIMVGNQTLNEYVKTL